MADATLDLTRPWNVCSHGNKLPDATYLVEFTVQGEIKITTPDDEKMIAKLVTCHDFNEMITNRVIAQVRERYWDSAKNEYRIKPTTNVFLLTVDGQVKEQESTLPKGKVVNASESGDAK